MNAKCFVSPLDRIRLVALYYRFFFLCIHVVFIFTASYNRIGINRRAEDFGLGRCLEKSFERNQSFPRISQQNLRRYEIDLDTPFKSKFLNMDKIRVDGANGLRFNSRRAKGCFSFTPNGTASPHNSTFLNSTSESIMKIPKAGINPNKAVFTIDSKTSQILIVNNNAIQLLGYSSKELCNLQFSSLLTGKHKSHISALAEGQLNSEDGTMVLLSGKVVEMTTKLGTNIAVSLWIRQFDLDGRCLAVAEPVERRVAEIIIDSNGHILSGDYEALMLFQLDTQEKFNGMEISSLIPAIQLPESNILPKNIRKQKATGKTQDGVSFPLCLMFSLPETGTDTTDSGCSNTNSTNPIYVITIWVFTNLSGLIVIDENGLIETCNHHFTMLMFGYAQNKMLGYNIQKIIPNFGQDFEYLGYIRSRNATISSLDNDESETETDHLLMDDKESDISKAISEPVKICLDFTSPCVSSKLTEIDENQGIAKSFSDNILLSENNKNIANLSDTKVIRNFESEKCNSEIQFIRTNDLELLTPVNETDFPDYLNSQISNNSTANSSLQLFTTADISYALKEDQELNFSKNTAGAPKFKKMIELEQKPNPESRRTSAHLPLNLNLLTKKNYLDGKYKGDAVHYDSNVIDILYQISSQTLPCGRKVFCVWICRDPDEYDFEDEAKNQNLTLTFNSVTSNAENSLGQAIKYTAAQNSSRPGSISLLSQCEEEQICGEYCKSYTTLKQIGKGAYGYVKMAYRNTDRLLVIAKFILKDKLCPQFMIVNDENKEVPMEIYLLTRVKHPNIVTVYDIYENEKFFQLVMEKHGSGMDLFEFIDRRPMMDEKLACFIFRQIANAVDYLHSLNILHRDIKDENIIIDQNFIVKLIDFGSATFMEEGKLFSTFFGTTEYCSPEVLAGNKYAGPELEMWSLGVTLYVLVFFENPFLDIEETLKVELTLPHKVSLPLELLLSSMLDKNPKTRIDMKQLLQHPWMNQEINPATFNFSWIVRCDSYESNPDKYFSGQVYSSTTALSTTSPQDSLSLGDEDSMDDEDDDEKSTQSQDGFSCDKGKQLLQL